MFTSFIKEMGAFLWISFFSTILLCPLNTAKALVIPIAYYTPESQVAVGALGVHSFDQEVEGKKNQILSVMSLSSTGQKLLTISPKFYFDKARYEWSGNLFYSYFPHKYFGNGSQTPLSEPEKYTENRWSLSQAFAFRFYNLLFGRLGGVFEQRSFTPPSESAPLFKKELESTPLETAYMGINAGIEWDSRDIPSFPQKGGFLRATFFHFIPHKIQSNAPTLKAYSKWELEGKSFLSLQDKWVLASQFLVSEIPGIQKLPFTVLNNLGGGQRLRGIYQGRFINRSLALLQSEIRWSFSEKWKASAFAGWGVLAENSSQFFSKGVAHLSTGIGARYVLDAENQTNLRLDFGLSEGETGVYFLMGEAF